MSSALDISASGMYAQRIRLDVISKNIANASTTRDANGAPNPYRRKDVIFDFSPTRSMNGLVGVPTPHIVEDTSAFRKEYDENHPDRVTDPNSPDFNYVYYPNVNPLVEFVNMIDATRAYEANVTAFEATKTMRSTALRLLG
ncbi:MAG: flagellar basal body rod protein FlgC [Planctomycetota bacterium]|nr:flagellar basal body rod protein FlgC [Planctomycetota bacterium]